jgi:hypothetical protein
MNIFFTLLTILSKGAFYLFFVVILLILLCKNPLKLDRIYTIFWYKDNSSNIFDIQNMSDDEKKLYILTQINTKLNTTVCDKNIIYHNKSNKIIIFSS